MVVYKSIISVHVILQTVMLFMIITRNFADDNNLNYGPYTIEYKEFKTCAGPKSKNLSHCTIELNKIKEDYYVANISLTFFTQSSFEKVKIKAYRVEHDQKKLLFNYNIDDACQHFAFSSIIENYFQAKGCVVKKGTYNVNLCLNNVTRAFYGKSSFYGEFETKAIVTSKEGNLWCCVVNMVFNKAR